jgi:hypothetical protein
MGTWDSAIDANDTFVDAYDCFFETYNQGVTAEQALEQVMEVFDDSDTDESIDVYFALALALWETKALSAERLQEVRRIIEDGDDLRRWRNLEATEELLHSRAAHLQSFLAKISIPRKSKKRRKKRKLDFSSNTLLELIAPDGKKVFTVSEQFINDDYLSTNALLRWSTSGSGIFVHETRGVKIEGRWLDSQNLELVIYGQPVFRQQRVAFYSGGDSGEITYLDESGEKIIPDSLISR